MCIHNICMPLYTIDIIKLWGINILGAIVIFYLKL